MISFLIFFYSSYVLRNRLFKLYRLSKLPLSGWNSFLSYLFSTIYYSEYDYHILAGTNSFRCLIQLTQKLINKNYFFVS